MPNITKLVCILLFMGMTLPVFSQTYLVDDFGAIGDGVTDDYIAIQNALYALRVTGGTLEFTSGKTYIISEGLSLYMFSVVNDYLITSTGAEKATIKMQDGTPLTWGHWMIVLTMSRNVTVRNLVWDGNRDTRCPIKEQSGVSVFFITGGSDGTRLENLDLINSPMDNLYIVVHPGQVQMTDFEMHNCRLENAFRNNMSVISGRNFRIIGCQFIGANGTDPQSGIDFEPDHSSVDGYGNMTVEGCLFKDNVRYGIELTFVKPGDGTSTIKNNTFDNNGILIGGKYCEIHNNIFINQDHQHLHRFNTRDGIIYFHSNFSGSNNDVYNNYLYDNHMPPGSHLAHFMSNVGADNHLHDNYGHGNTVNAFVLNNSNPPQTVSNNVLLNRREMGYWSMDNSEVNGTTLTDLSDFNNDGLIVNAPTSVSGKINEALDFSPDNKYVSIDTSNNLNIQINITLSTWLKWNGPNADAQQVFIGRKNDWRFGIANDGRIGFYSAMASDTSYNADWIRADLADALPINEWKFVSYTYDGRYAKLYIDGVEVKSEQANGVLGTSESKIYIGSFGSTIYSFNGSIDEVKIYNYALTSSEITKLKASTYYVDFTTGNDMSDGLSPATAFKTITKINNLDLSAGDHVLFNRGESWKGTRLYIEDRHGFLGSEIVYGAYGTGAKPILSSIVSHPHIWTNVGGNIWKADNPPAEHPERMLIDGAEKLRANIPAELDGVTYFWRYDNDTNDLYIYSATNPNGGMGLGVSIEYTADFPVIVGESEFIKIEDLDLQGGWTAIFINELSQHISLENMNLGKYASDGVVTNASSNTPADYPQYITIDNCTFDAFFAFDYSSAGDYAGSSDRGSGDGIRAEALTIGEIKNCTFKNWGHASWSLNGGLALKVSEVKVHDNFMTSPDITYGGRIGVDDAVNNEIYRNHIKNTTVQSQLNGQNNHYHHNIFDGTTNTPIVTSVIDAGIEMQGYGESEVMNNIFENNIIANTEGPGFRISGNNDNDIHNNIIRNNIIYNCGTVVSGVSLTVESDLFEETFNNTFSNNLIFSSLTAQSCDFRGVVYDVAGFNSQTGTDGYNLTNNIGVDPIFVDPGNSDFHLQGTSPCVEGGGDIIATRDYDGNPIPLADKADIGAYEFGIYWNGSVSYGWHIPENWSTNLVPTAIDSVTIPRPEFFKFHPKVGYSDEVKKITVHEKSRLHFINNVTFDIKE